MNKESIENIIFNIFREKKFLGNLEKNDDFFDLGVSSLTIIELQIMVEEALEVEVLTNVLMSSPTIKEWVDVYTSKVVNKELTESGV